MSETNQKQSAFVSFSICHFETFYLFNIGLSDKTELAGVDNPQWTFYDYWMRNAAAISSMKKNL